MVDACNPRAGEVQAKGSGVEVTLAYIESWRRAGGRKPCFNFEDISTYSAFAFPLYTCLLELVSRGFLWLPH